MTPDAKPSKASITRSSVRLRKKKKGNAPKAVVNPATVLKTIPYRAKFIGSPPLV